MGNITFRPVRGKESSILDLPIIEGSAYFTTDTGKIFIDTADARLPMGGSGAAILYGNAADDLSEDETTQLYHLPKNSLEPKQGTPKVGDIIINQDGRFYRVKQITDVYFLCALLAVSGNGDTTSGGKTRPTLLLEELDTQNLINGQDARVYLTATAAQVNGVSLSRDITIKWSLTADGEARPYHSDQKTVTSGERNFIDFGKYLRDSASTTMTLQATALNHEADSWIQTISLTTSTLDLSHVSSFSPTNIYNPNNVVLSCNASGNTEKILDFWFDGELLEHRILKASDIETQSYTVPVEKCNHGYHTVHIRLYQSIDGDYGLEASPSLKFEIPVVISGDTTQKPIIWLGEYKDVYYNYDSIQIPYLVYDPQDTTKAFVHLYKNRIELEGSPLEIKNLTSFSYWEIADAELNQQNFYQLSCGEDENRKVEREISFKVEQDPNRSMTLVKQDNLKLNFDPIGRTNSESVVKRASWKQNGIEAQFENFNWYNNGWKPDEETKQTKLIISNGAKLTIPFGRLVFADIDASKQSNSIEMQFRIRNIQNYQNLITNVTRYQIKTGEDSYITDEEYYNAFIAPEQTRYDNYDAYLQATLDPDLYEKLEYWKVQKNINLNNVAIGFYDALGNNSARGFCVGTQDAFFSNGTNTVNVNFVEEDLINLSFVYSHSLKMLFIYINGCITGVIKSDLTTTFPIESGNIIFDSSNCDIDLFKFRIYNTDLNVNDIVVNYAVDRKDIETYDQNSLASENLTLKEYQLQFEGDKGVDSYNKAHPNDPLMPYIIYDTTDFEDNRLPWSKDITRNIKVEFINTPLDRAYANGELETLAKEDGLVSKNETNYDVIQEAIKTYYKHHCPSWTSTLSANDRVEIVVQGTSSEFYPRRNFKIKTKVKDVTIWDEDEKVKDEQGNETGEKGAFVEDDVLNIYMHKGPFEEVYNNDAIKVVEDQKYYGHEDCRLADGWYMNNYTNPTDRWTMKVDYMESSGSYNAGFASLIGNAYTKHPLQDYLGVISGQDNLKSTIAAFSRDIRWEEDYRTSLLGFPVMAFQKRLNSTTGKPEYLFVGYYRMLLDKGSDKVLGFKPSKKVVSTLFKDAEGKAKPMRDVAECWEFATNSRTFCSFKDPWNRVKFSFKSPVGESNEFTADKAPMVMNHFEYRYHWAEDYLDKLFKYKTLDQETLNELVADVRKDTGKTAEEIPDLVTYSNNDDNARAAQELTLSFYKNWEDVCSWVWSTNLENVPAQGTYSEEPVKLGKEIYNPQAEYYILTTNEAGETIYERDTSGAFNSDVLVYYIKEVNDGKTSYVNGHICGSEKNLYKKNTFYKKVSGTYSLVTDATFDPNIEYYTFTSYSDLVLSGYDENWNKVADGLADLLVKPATGTFDSSKIYFTYDGTKKINKTKETGAVQKVAAPNGTDFAAGLYYELAPMTYSGIEYKYDTQEYRSAKFINELTQHFDPEYLATYFVATEVFELYDSRGKNCMMASWGPQKPGGNYIWYPIFYDIDTQLGINNTGIPSFEFNVDASDAGNYSTSDSILWNNFYKFFKSSYILTKYQNMRGTKSSWKDLKNPPLQSVDYIEKWYTFDPKTHNSIACRGKRPLIATNLDMYFKYITITNEKAVDQGVGYLLGQDGVPSIDQQGAYFYALQGDRSQSRRQFLTNRLEYIDSWLNQGNYARAGNNRIRGRISANNISGGSIKDVHSDKWIETDEETYWLDKEFGTKRHEFDSQYWLDLKPIRSSYVTAGDDSANYPSKKYDGLNTTKFKLAELEQGIRRGANYPEQLLYIYGMNQMQDVGDMSKLYWTEFFIEGTANKLTRLKLGHDGISTTDPNVNGGRWYNNKLNGITLTDLPLLKEANFSHIGLSNETTLNFKKSEKLENFRATGTSKLTSVQFAEGVALNTLYLPESVTNLTLTQANLLTDLITDPNDAIPRVDGDNLIAKPGLYIEGFFGNNFTSSINTINLDGGALGHNSYTLLKRFYQSKLSSTGTIISMTDVNWCPYVKLSEGDEIDFNYAYYRDEGHYLLEYYPINSDTYNAKTFNALILSGELYRVGPYTLVQPDEGFNDRRVYFKKVKQDHYELIDLTADTYNAALANNNLYYIAKSPVVIDDSAYDMLEDLYTNNRFRGIGDGSRPKITGTILIENSTAKEESEIRRTLQAHYPDVTFFFTNVTKAYSAKFIIYDNDTESYSYVKMKDGTSVPSIQKIAANAVTKDDEGNITTRFASPFELYNPIKTHYDFQGWSTVPNPGTDDIILTPPKDGEPDPWLNSNISLIQNGTEDYVFYAIFTIHEYVLTFYNHDGTQVLETKKIPYNSKAVAPTLIPYRDDSELTLYQSYDFEGYSLAIGGSKIDVSTITVTSDEEFYANFKLIEDIRTVVHPDWFKFTMHTYDESQYLPNLSTYSINGYIAEPVVALQGKIVIPRSYNGYPVIAIAECGANNIYDLPHRITHVFVEKAKDGDTSKPIVEIRQNAFSSMQSLKYFEFENTGLRIVQNGGFINCNLEAEMLTLHHCPLQIVGYMGFLGGILSSTKTSLILPSSLIKVDDGAFRNLSCAKGTSLIIGEEKDPSKLDFSRTDDGFGIFNQNDETAFGSVIFYSALYDSPDDEARGYTVQDYFATNMESFVVY